MKDYRATIKIRNNRILRAIEAAGGKVGVKWCEANGLNYGEINAFIHLRLSPITESGELRAQAAMLCEATGCLPYELWSAEQVRPLEKCFAELELSASDIESIAGRSEDVVLEDLVFDAQRSLAISDALKSLPGRCGEVLRLRCFEDMSLSEIGERLGVSVERARQIEQKGLRHLRNPKVGLQAFCVSDDVLC